MGPQFINEFFWKSQKDVRAWVSVVGLLVAAASGLTDWLLGWHIIMPPWAWLVVAFLGALSMAVRSDWAAFKERNRKPRRDMPLLAAVQRIVGAEEIIVEGKQQQVADALLALRQHAHLNELTVWARRNAITNDLAQYLFSPVPSEYWEEFGIDYLPFIKDQRGISRRAHGTPRRDRVLNAVMTTMHNVEIPDTIYRDFWFCSFQVDAIWPPPKARFALRSPIAKMTS
jgi:hypothetical protein